MAGIFGVLDHSPDRRARSIAVLAKKARGDFELKVTLGESDPIAFGTAFTASPQPSAVTSSDGQVTLLIQGEILCDPSHSRSDDLLRDLRADPIATLEKCGGAYAGALIDHKASSITLFADQFSNFRLHYAIAPDRIAFSTQATALANLFEAAVDEGALFEYITSSQNFGARTLWHGVRSVRAGEIVRSSLQGQMYESFAAPKRAPSLAAATTREIATALMRSVERSVEGKRVAAGLSGGMDTRLMWSAILAGGHNVTAHSHGTPGSRDLGIGEAISDRLGLPSQNLHFDDAFIERSVQHAEQLVRMSEGGLRLQECFILDIWKLLAKDHDVLLDGHGGAIYSRQVLKFAALRVKTTGELANVLHQRLLTPLARSSLLRGEVRQAAKSALFTTLVEELGKYNGIESIGDIIDTFYIRDLGRRGSLSGNAQLNLIGLHHPLLTRDLEKLARGVPMSEKLRHAVHAEVIRQLSPQLSRFAVDNDGLPATFRGLAFTRAFPVVYERIVRKLPAKLYSKLSLMKPAYTASQFLAPQRNDLSERLLRLPKALMQLIDGSALEGLTVRLAKGDGIALQEASALASTAIVLEMAS